LTALAVFIVGLACQAPPRDADAWQRDGLQAHLKNDFQSSIPALQQALRLNPRLWTAELFLGIGYYRTNRFAEAALALERSSTRAEGRGRDEVDYWLGATRIALRQPLAGLRSLEKLLARQPDHADALELAARTYSDVSSSLWNGVAERDFDTPAGYQIHGYALEGEGSAAAAVEYFEKSQRLQPNRPGPRREIGRLKMDRAMLEGEVRLAPRDAVAHHLLGLMDIEAGDWPGAIAHLTVAMEWSRANPEPAIALAQVHLGRQQAADAAHAARRAVVLAPGSLAAHELLVTAYERSRQAALAQQERDRWQRRLASPASPREGAVPVLPRP